MKIIALILLFPFSILYNIVTSIRNYLYNTGYKKSIHFDTVTISVGNLTVGGTGKTPHVEYLINLLKESFHIAVLSRGYGRKTRGIIIADTNAAASSIGDEPMQYFNKFKNTITVAVGEERALAIPTILYEVEKTRLIILDDAFQHRKVKPDINILINDYNRPFYNDHLLPAGRLREGRKGAKRADVIIVSKCPQSISDEKRREICNNIKVYSHSDAPVFFTAIKYGTPVSVYSEEKPFRGSILLVSAIARPEVFENYVRVTYNFSKHIKFRDHHSYTIKDAQFIVEEFEKVDGKEKCILITEKDMVKWRSQDLQAVLFRCPVFYLPIKVEFVNGKVTFDEWIRESINRRLKEIER